MISSCHATGSPRSKRLRPSRSMSSAERSRSKASRPRAAASVAELERDDRAIEGVVAVDRRGHHDLHDRRGTVGGRCFRHVRRGSTAERPANGHVPALLERADGSGQITQPRRAHLAVRQGAAANRGRHVDGRVHDTRARRSVLDRYQAQALRWRRLRGGGAIAGAQHRKEIAGPALSVADLDERADDRTNHLPAERPRRGSRSGAHRRRRRAISTSGPAAPSRSFAARPLRQNDAKSCSPTKTSAPSRSSRRSSGSDTHHA